MIQSQYDYLLWNVGLLSPLPLDAHHMYEELPHPLPVAAPERSPLDQQHFQVDINFVIIIMIYFINAKGHGRKTKSAHKLFWI